MQSLTCTVATSDEHSIASSPLEALLEASGDVTLHLSEAGLATFTSRSAKSWATDMFAVGSSFFDLFEASAKPSVQRAFTSTLMDGKITTLSAPMSHHLGRNLTWKLCRYVVGQKRGVLAVAQEDTARQELELKLLQTTSFDGLTSLPNRSTAQNICAELQEGSSVAGRPLYFALIHISGLAKINTAMGSCVGDAVLIEMVSRLNAQVEGCSRVLRVGSTEFGMFISSQVTHEEQLRSTRQLISLLEAPYHIGGDTLHIKAHVGLTSVTNEKATFDEFYAAASCALKSAREYSQFAYLDLNKGGIPEAKEFMLLETALHTGVRNGELSLVYQPLYRSSGLYGVEALMRWRNADGKEVSPGVFIPVAEANGLIQMLGEWALKRATFEVARFNKAEGLSLQVSVNVSPAQFLTPGFRRTISTALEASGLEPSLLQLEITEGTLMAAPVVVDQLLRDLTSKGVRIAIDDFGTGYSSLSYLKKFTLSALKIDQSFIRELPNNSSDFAVCAAIVELARRMGLDVVAEGIESQAQLEAIKSLSETAAFQGYFFGRPAPLQALAK